METNDDAVRVIARLARLFETRLGEDSMTLAEAMRRHRETVAS